MVNRVVSTKLSEEEHSKILEFCNDTGITVSSMVKHAIMEKIKSEQRNAISQNLANKPKLFSENARLSKVQQVHEDKIENEHENRYMYF